LRNLSGFEIIILFLSIYVVIELYISSIVSYPYNVTVWAERVDIFICIIFLFDFFNRFFRVDNKWQFLKGNWIDFISSIPTVGFLRIGRIVRIIKVLRVLRSGKTFYRFIDKDNSSSTFRYVVLLNIILILLSSLSLYHIEHEVNSDISTIGDSIWWCLITTTTLGFVRDVEPITIEGKALSVILIGLGIMLFGTFTGMVTDYFVGDEDIRKDISNVNNRLDVIEKKLDRLLKEE